MRGDLRALRIMDVRIDKARRHYARQSLDRDVREPVFQPGESFARDDDAILDDQNAVAVVNDRFGTGVWMVGERKQFAPEGGYGHRAAPPAITP